MAGFDDSQAVLHPVPVDLYPNHLNEDGKYLGRLASYRTINVRQICENLRVRGSFTGDPEDAVNNILHFCEESGFLICDGFTLNLGYYSISIHIGGTWDSFDELHDRDKHPIGFTFRVLKPLKDMASRILLSRGKIEDKPAYIAQVTDISSGAVDQTLTPGGVIVIEGHRIKITGTKPGVGLYIEGTQPAGVPYSAVIPQPYVENEASKVIAVLPAGIPNGTYKLQINTQYAGTSTLLKDIRMIQTNVSFTVGAMATFGAAPSGDGSGTEASS
jgi:hypothetical protein